MSPELAKPGHCTCSFYRWEIKDLFFPLFLLKRKPHLPLIVIHHYQRLSTGKQEDLSIPKLLGADRYLNQNLSLNPSLSSNFLLPGTNFDSPCFSEMYVRKQFIQKDFYNKVNTKWLDAYPYMYPTSNFFSSSKNICLEFGIV